MSFVKPILGALSLSTLLLAGCDERPHLAFNVVETDAGPLGDASADATPNDDGGTLDAEVAADAMIEVDAAAPDASLDASMDAAASDASLDASMDAAASDASSFDCIARDSAELTAKLLDVRCERIDLVANTFEGTFVAARKVRLVGASRETTTLEGVDTSRDPVLTVGPGVLLVEVEGLTVTGGVSGGIGASSPISLVDVTLSGNHGPNGGGGLYATSDVTITNSVVRDNTTSLAGAGVAVFGTGTQTIRIEDTVVESNAVSAGDLGGGGGIAVVGAARVELDGSRFDGNSVVGRSSDDEGNINGGGALLANIDVVVVTNSSFSGNSVTSDVGAGGAGFVLSSCPNATFEDIFVDENTVDSHGETPAGARIGNSSVTVRRASFRANRIRQDWATSIPTNRYDVRGAGFAMSNSQFVFEDVVVANNVIDLIDPPSDLAVHAAGAAFQAWSGDSAGAVRRSSFVGNRVDVTQSVTAPLFTGDNISGVGVWVPSDEEWSNFVEFVNTTIGENECDLAGVRSSEVAMEAFESSQFQVHFANATVVGYLGNVAISSSIGPTPAAPSRVEFANSIVDNFGAAARCVLDAATTAASRGHNLVPESCVLPAAWQASDTALDDTTHAGLAARVGLPIPHYPFTFPNLALDGGNPLGCTDVSGAAIMTDALGSVRIGVCDVGAYEAELIP